MQSFKTGEKVVLVGAPSGATSTPRASAPGASYWVIEQILDGGRLLLRTHQGGMRVVPERSAQLRRPFWWETLLLAGRFPTRHHERVGV